LYKYLVTSKPIEINKIYIFAPEFKEANE
jgi:hypothetical protein